MVSYLVPATVHWQMLFDQEPFLKHFFMSSIDKIIHLFLQASISEFLLKYETSKQEIVIKRLFKQNEITLSSHFSVYCFFSLKIFFCSLKPFFPILIRLLLFYSSRLLQRCEEAVIVKLNGIQRNKKKSGHPKSHILFAAKKKPSSIKRAPIGWRRKREIGLMP